MAPSSARLLWTCVNTQDFPSNVHWLIRGLCYFYLHTEINQESPEPGSQKSYFQSLCCIYEVGGGKFATVHVEVQWIGGQCAGSLVKAYHWG